MALFNVPQRADKSKDLELVKKSKSTKKPSPTIKGGGGLLGVITKIKYLVEHNLGKYKDDYVVIRDIDTLRDYFIRCISNGVISIDTETTGLDPIIDKIVGLCLYTPKEKAAYVPINHTSYITGARASGQLDEKDVKECLDNLIQSKLDIIMFNAKFDIRVIRNQLCVKDIYCTFDCMLAARLLNENEPSNRLKKLHQKYVLNDKEDEFTFDELFNGITFDKVPIDTGYLYAAHDAVITYELYEFQKQFIRADNDRKDLRDIAWVFYNIEMPCVEVVADMEDNGIEFDWNKHSELSEKYHKLLKEQAKKVYNEIKKYEDKIDRYKLKNINHRLEDPINLDSSTQIAILLYDVLGVESVDSRNSRGTGSDILEKIENPICKELIKYRELSKLVSAFIDSLPEYVNKTDNRIHCSFKQYGAKTGRMSCSEPNLQQIPSHNKEIRQMFKASDGYVLMSSDYSAQEPRLMAELCGDEKMINAYKSGRDLYSEIASFAFNTTYEECLEHFPKGTPIKKLGDKWYYATENDYDKIADGETDAYADGKARRSSSKSLLLGILYGRGINSVADQLHTTKEKAQQIQDKIFKGFPAIPKFEQDSLNMARELGCVFTFWGSKRRLPDMQLPEFSFEWLDGKHYDDDILDFSTKEIEIPIPDNIINKYLRQLSGKYSSDKKRIIESAKKENIKITDNGGKIADATRQCVNARIQGCLDGDVRVQSKEFGFIKLKDFVNQSLTLWDGGEWTPATIVSSGEKQKCVVHFVNGQSIVCSPDHKFLVVNTRGNTAFKATKELKKGSHLVINKKYVSSDFVYKSDWAHTYRNSSHNANLYRLDDIKNRFDLGLFLGRLASDGSYRVRNDGGSYFTHILAEHEFEILPIIEKIASPFKCKIDIQNSPRDGRTQRMAYINGVSRSLVNEINMLDIKHRVDDNIFMDTEMLRGFISGFFDGDGGATGDHSIVLTFGVQCDFREMIHDLQKALLFYGIRSSYRFYAGYAHKLCISVYDASKFCDLIGFINSDKQKKAEQISAKKDEHVFGASLIVDHVEILDDFIPMYDVCNTKNGYFVADGIVTHNSAAQLTKLAMIKLSNDKRLKELGFRLLVPIHDELLAECPLENVKECSKRFSDLMIEAGNGMKVPSKCDVSITHCWYGEEINL